MIEYISQFQRICYDTLDSTQNEAKRLINLGKLQPCSVVTAMHQNAGVARNEKKWISARGNIYATFCVFVKDLAEPHHVPFVTALAVGETIKSICPNINFSYKWVNDVFIEDAKVAGILVEYYAQKWLLIGIGINVSHAPEIQGRLVTSLKKHSIDNIDINEIENTLSSQLAHFLNQWSIFGFIPIRHKWMQKCRYLNQYIEISSSGKVHSGIFTGIDENGAMLLMQSGHQKIIYAPDLF